MQKVEHMGMFDWYRPAGKFECPVCHTALREWQGKDGACALYVWQQGGAAPVDQACDEECKGLPEITAASRLPAEFAIYSYDCERHCIYAACTCIDDVWSETSLAGFFDRLPSVTDRPT